MKKIVKHKRTQIYNNKPSSDILNHGELAINYAKDSETIYLKNSENEVIDFKSYKYI